MLTGLIGTLKMIKNHKSRAKTLFFEPPILPFLKLFQTSEQPSSNPAPVFFSASTSTFFPRLIGLCPFPTSSPPSVLHVSSPPAYIGGWSLAIPHHTRMLWSDECVSDLMMFGDPPPVTICQTPSPPPNYKQSVLSGVSTSSLQEPHFPPGLEQHFHFWGFGGFLLILGGKDRAEWELYKDVGANPSI